MEDKREQAIVNIIFERIFNITHEDGQREFASALFKYDNEHTMPNQINLDNISNNFNLQRDFLQKIYKEIDDLAKEIKNDNTILISVKNQKLLRTCFHLVTSIGISSNLIPGLGITLSKRCSSAVALPSQSLTDEQKYEMVTACTDFFTRSYEVPVLKNIIMTFHLCDYLAALIQLSFAPLKKPGTYKNFIMTQELYDQLILSRQKYVEVYEYLVSNCFQPTLMKELLVLQSVTNPSPPMFAKRTIARDMSRRLLAPGGLLSLIRCFIESYDTDTGLEWKKIDMICKIVATKHGSDSQDNYLNNICSQLLQILTSDNMHYLTTAVSCVLSLHEEYPHSDPVKALVNDIFHAFDYDNMLSKSNLPGTIILSPQEVEHKVNILHACMCTRLECSTILLSPNLYVLFLLGVRCTKSEEMKIKLKEIILKCLERLHKSEILTTMKKFLFGLDNKSSSDILIDEFDAGVAIKYIACNTEHPTNDCNMYLLNVVNTSTDNRLAENIFEASLQMLIDLSGKRQKKFKQETLLTEEVDVIFDDVDEQYATILQLLSEISTSVKVVSALKTNPSIVLPFIENSILSSQDDSDECVTMSLVLLNTILSSSIIAPNLQDISFNKLTPFLRKMAENDSNFNSILCKEALSLISSEICPEEQNKTACGKAISQVLDSLLPVRAHGLIELTKLIETRDPETISKKHYIFCLFQEQLKDPDSYIYLSAINGIASLGTYCSEDVVQVLCAEFLKGLPVNISVATVEDQNKTAELRMKVGDIIVKVTRNLGEMTIVFKSLLLNTVLCGCRDDDPLIRASALSNLAEIALVLNYKIGTIIYEVLLCIWGIIETDKAIECKRAAVMVITSLLRGLGKETLVQLKENLLPIYRTLKKLYGDPDEDSVVRLHAQIALEELNATVSQILFPELNVEKRIFVMDDSLSIFK